MAIVTLGVSSASVPSDLELIAQEAHAEQADPALYVVKKAIRAGLSHVDAQEQRGRLGYALWLSGKLVGAINPETDYYLD